MTKRLSKQFLFNIAVLFIPALMIMAAIQPDFRDFLRNKLVPEERQAISLAIGDLLGDGTPVQVLKVKTRDALVLEIYRPGIKGRRELVDRIKMDQSKDAYFNFKGQMINLAVEKVAGDVSILAPAFDQNLSAHLNIYKYNKSTKSFDHVSRPL